MLRPLMLTSLTCLFACSAETASSPAAPASSGDPPAAATQSPPADATPTPQPAQKDPDTTSPQPFDPSQLPSCLVWLRADRDATGADATFAWKSACGGIVAKPISGYDGSKGTIAKVDADPDFGGKASVRFHAEDPTASGSTGVDLGKIGNGGSFAATTYYAIVRPDEIASDHRARILCPGEGFGDTHVIGFGAGDNPYALYVGGNGPGHAFGFYNANVGSAGTVMGKTHLVTVVLETSSGRSYLDGAIQATGSSSVFASVTSAVVGACTSGSDAFQGRIAELFAFGEAHDGATVVKMQKYFADRYGLSL